MSAKISVVIAAYNCAAWIGKAIDSVYAQSRPVDEIIVVDDCSADNVREVLPAPVRYMRHEINRGLSAARNTGVRGAIGDYLVFLDADDELVPDAIEKMMCAMESTGASWCITDALRIENGKTGVWRSSPPDQDLLPAILENDFVMLGIFFRRSDFEEIGMWDEALRARNDWDINIRMIEAGKPFCYVAEPLYRYYRRESSISNGEMGNVLDCTRRVLDKHHLRFVGKGKKFDQAYGAALWQLGRFHWEVDHRFAAVYYALASVLRERSLERVRPFLKRNLA